MSVMKLKKLINLRNKIQDKINKELNRQIMSKMWNR